MLMNKNHKRGKGMAIGIVLGTIIGVLLDNMGAWLAIGVALGAGLESKMSRNKEDIIDQ